MMNDKWFQLCIKEDQESDPWKPNCTKHKVLCPSYPLLSIHASIPLLCCLYLTHTSKTTGLWALATLHLFTATDFKNSFTAKQCPPFCQVQSRDGAAAISQTLQSSACSLMQTSAPARCCGDKQTTPHTCKIKCDFLIIRGSFISAGNALWL